MTQVLVFGGSGYSGLELLRWLIGHPDFDVVAVSSDRWAGQAIAEHLPGWPGNLCFGSHQDTLAAARAGQLAALATPATASVALVPELLSRGVRVVDLSGAFRLRDASAYPGWYGFTHPQPGLLAEAHYGLVELFEMPQNTRLVANPGCYATAAILAAAPLLSLRAAGAPIFLDGKSGTTGAGRSADEKLSFSEVAENLRPYRLVRHQHTPEIAQALAKLAQTPVRVSFTAHLIPMRRGLLVSAYTQAREALDATEIELVLKKYQSTFVRVRSQPPETAAVQGTNFVDLHECYDKSSESLLGFAALDNLVKGAAGQALQNLNRLAGLPAERGLLVGR